MAWRRYTMSYATLVSAINIEFEMDSLYLELWKAWEHKRK